MPTKSVTAARFPRTRRRIVLFGLLIMALAGGAVVWGLKPPDTAITRDNAAKINKGMMLAEIEMLLGGGERLENTGPTEADTDHHGPAPAQIADQSLLENLEPSRSDRPIRTWASDRVAIVVVFDANERVAEFAVHPLRPASLVAMLRRWLRL